MTLSPAKIFARPTADRVWLGPAQRAALSRLSEPAQVKLLTGPCSSGKTTLLTHLAGQLQDSAVVLHSTGRKNDACALLSTLLLSAELAPWALEEIDQRNLLAVFIQERHSQGKRVVIVIDDAHRLGPEAWQEVDRLRRYQLKNGPAVELLLAAAPGVVPPWHTERGSTAFAAHALIGATPADIAGYIEWRMAQHGVRNPFNAEAMQLAARVSDGRYAAVDALCQMTMMVLRKQGRDQADAASIQEAMTMLSARRSARAQAIEPAAEGAPRDTTQASLLVCSESEGTVLERVPLAQRVLIGRGQDNDVCLPSPYLSRHHALILGGPDGYHLVDLNSVNGVLLNRRRVVERAILADQDIVTIGPFHIKVQLPARAAALEHELALESLAETALVPPRRPSTPPMRRVK